MYTLRHIQPNDKLIDQLHGHLLFSIYQPEIIDQCCAQFPSPVKRRVRHFTPRLVFLLLLMSTLWPRLSLHRVWQKIAKSFSDLHPTGLIATISRTALTYQRQRFDSEILHLIMQTCCKPMCTPRKDPNAFYHGQRLVAIDGTKTDAPDSPDNVSTFGRSSNQYGPGPFPQVQGVSLMECGSRATLDIVLGAHADAEVHALPLLLPRLTADMLVITDSGFFSGWFCEQLQDTIGAELLSAISSTTALTVEKRLSDGSYIITLYPNHSGIYRSTRPIRLRIIEYFIHDDRFGEPGVCYRLATTLLDEHLSPAGELITIYHDRWEIETMLDEAKTHQREQVCVWRSQSPEGIKQEVYALILSHYAICFWKHQAAERRGVDADRISFTEAMCQVKDAIDESLKYAPKSGKRIVTRMLIRIALKPLPPRRLRINRRERKKLYSKYKAKKRDVPPLETFDPEEQFLDYVEVWERPDGVLPVGKQRGRKRTIVSHAKEKSTPMKAKKGPIKKAIVLSMHEQKMRHKSLT